MNNYEDNILEAIETIVDSSIAKSNYDRTIQATVIKLIDKSLGQYNVKYQDSYLDAFSVDTTIEYVEGTNVYILIPNGDMSKNKTILGAVDGYKIQGVTAITDADASDPVGYNCVNDNIKFELCSYIEEQNIILYDKDNNINLIDLDNDALKNFLQNSSQLVAGASFKTNLPGEQRLKGNYGIIFELGFKAQTSDEIILKKFIIDIDRMSGNPYTLNNATPQLGYFEIDGENFEYVNNITIFEKDFPYQATDKDNDIFISELQIFGSNRISEEEYNVARLVINTPQGNYFTEQDSLQTTKQLVAKIKTNGTEMDLSKGKVEYYWFKENDDITIESQKYNLYGGEGWECLNDFTLVDSNNPNLVTWSSASNIWNVAKASVRNEQVQYKCVVIYNDIILQRLVTLKNQGAAISIKIVSDLGADFIDGLGYPTLTCMINDSEEPLTGYKYVWSRTDNNGLYIKLDETTEENLAYQNAYNNYENLLTQIQTEQAFPNAVAAQLEEYKNEFETFEKITRIDKNKIYKINTSEITNYMHYKCSVYYNNEYVGTESIILYNTNSTDQDYFIQLINGTQIFKYDENGISPCDETKDNPQEVLPLQFNIINKEGLDITNEILEKSQIEWKIPTENTLITVQGSLTARELPFTIDNFYDNTKNNNEIKLTVTYKKQKLVSYTNLSFIKEGDVGTNGTDYYCKIVPNTSQKVDYPMIINGILNYTPVQEGKWFKAQIWRGGKLIFEGAESGASIESDRAIVRWGIQKNKYNAQVSDPSTISIVNNIFSTTGYYIEDGSGANCPANIVQCKITFKGIDYFITIPVITVYYNDPYQIYLEPKTGFNFVTYSSDGRYPKYNDNKPFEIQVLQTINGVKENISLLHSNQYGVKFEWYIRGQVYDTKTGLWIDKILFTVDETEILEQNKIKLIPVSEYSGECVSTGLECICKKKSDNTAIIGKIHIPIHCMLNRYANAAINGWDGNNVTINDTDGYILTPQVGAGTKNEQNQFTGMLMGSVKDNANGITKTGLLGYDAGQQSLFLDAESGGAIFGKDNGGQITIDPQNNKSYLFSHNYWKNYNDKGFPVDYTDSNQNNAGMLIDLATPQIVFGSGNFKVDKDGNVTCGEMLTSRGILTMLRYENEGFVGWDVNSFSTDYITKTATRKMDGFTETMTLHCPNYFEYAPNLLLFSCFIPEGFSLYKTVCTLEQYSYNSPYSVDNWYGEKTSDIPSWVTNTTTEYGIDQTIPGSVTDAPAVWFVPYEAYTRVVGRGSMSGGYNRYSIDTSKCIRLGMADSGFPDAVTTPQTTVLSKVIDFSGAVANNYLVPGQVNLLAVMPGNILDKVPLTWNSVSFTDKIGGDTSATFNTWRATPGTANLKAWCKRRTGYVKVQIILYGYYDPSLTNNNN